MDLDSVQAVYDNDGKISTGDSGTKSEEAGKTIDTTNVNSVKVTPSDPADKSGTVAWTFNSTT